jgi:predicted DNA-binding protein (MmcQ/YjbR family)
MDWDDVIDPWKSETGTERSDEVEQLIKQSYRILAQKFPQTQEWARANQS